MRVETNMADQRKLLARAISEWIHEPVQYEGVPSCAYRIGTVRVERGGVIASEDSQAWATLQPFFQNHGWAEDADTAEEAPAPMPETTDCASLPNLLEISEPVPGATVNGLKNIVFMLHGKQKLLNKVTGGETIHIPDLLVNRLREYTPETLEEFTQLLDDCGAMDELQGFDYRDGKVTISFPHDENQPVIWTTYGTLVDKIVKAAMSATRVSPEENGAESEKYGMRSWLLRLGYSGADFKAQRQLLTRNLTGSSAFPDAAKAKKHTKKYLALRKAAREAKEGENERAD